MCSFRKQGQRMTFSKIYVMVALAMTFYSVQEATIT